MVLDKAWVVYERALVCAFCFSLGVKLSDDTWNIEHLFYFFDLRSRVASHLPLRYLELRLNLMLNPVMHSQFLLLFSCMNIVLQLLAEVGLQGSLVI